MATIRDIARLAGVSKSTVSNVINGRDARVSKETRRRVRETMQDLNYRPNGVARSLAINQTFTAAVLVSDVSREPYARALKAVEEVLRGRGYNVIVANTANDVEREKRALDTLIERRIDGILFISFSGVKDNQHLIQLANSDFPLVLVNRFLPEGGVDTVAIDNTKGVTEAVLHLHQLGHTDIGCIHTPVTGGRETHASVERLQGFHQGMQEAGLTEQQEWICSGEFGEPEGIKTGYALAMSLLTQGRKPTALVCANDYLAIGAIRAALQLNLRVPEDLAVTGHDDTVAGRYHVPAVTTVAQPMSEAASKAAARLLSRIAGKEEENAPFSLSLQGRLIIRASTKLKPFDPTRID